MITYDLNETLEQAIISLAIDHESDDPSNLTTCVAVAEVILSNGRKAQVALMITEDKHDVFDPDAEDLPMIDISGGKEIEV